MLLIKMVDNQHYITLSYIEFELFEQNLNYILHLIQK